MRTTGPAASPASSARCVAKLITIAAAQAQQHGIAPQNRVALKHVTAAFRKLNRLIC
jgi:ribosomal protein L22